MSHCPRIASIGSIGAILFALAGCKTADIGVLSAIPRPISNTYVRATVHRPREPAPPLGLAAPSFAAADRSDWFPPRGLRRRWDSIVIHHSASATGNAKRFDRYHRESKNWDELGYHFVIGNGQGARDGLVEVGSRWIKQKHGAHCKTADNRFNLHGIGICLVGDFSKTAPTGAQMASLVRLIRFLVDECDVPSESIYTHRGVTGKTVCPGKHFPFVAMRRAVSTTRSASVMP
jgi:N-acetylmuramoyl-L-alanine amidase-like protein